MSEALGHQHRAQLQKSINESEENADSSTKPSTSEANGKATGSSRTTALKARKRTKTGCLTCRKRRIKCGEERPTCKNCVKSKRECEGYVHRVIFKHPLGAFRPAQQGLAARTDQSPNPNGANGMYRGMPSTSLETPIAPRLLPHGSHPALGASQATGRTRGAGNLYSPTSYLQGSHFHPGANVLSQQQILPRGGDSYEIPNNGLAAEDLIRSHADLASYPSFQYQPTSESDSGIELAPPDLPHGWSDPSTAPSTELLPAYTEAPVMSSSRSYLRDIPQSSPWPRTEGNDFSYRRPSLSSQSIGGFAGSVGLTIQDAVTYPAQTQNHRSALPSQTSWISEAEDDYLDVDSDDENSTFEPQTATSSYDPGAMVKLTAGQGERGIRSMTDFLNEPNILATYRPSYAASPLMDRQTARVFCHFVTATAPTLAVCERHPSNPAILFSGEPVPRSQRSLWSYTLPTLALTHQALLHAMLALGSLHIAKLQHASTMPSLKHYHYALRKVAKALGNREKRRNVATLAATLLLGFYEVTTAEHNKWNSHLSGARELVMEIDFAGMARRIEAHRCQQEEAEFNFKREMQQHGFSNMYGRHFVQGALDDFPTKTDRQLDRRLISTIMGCEIRYDQYGRLIEGTEPFPDTDEPLTAGDIENFEVQSDLFWWYAKHDIYQSIISRNRLLLSYDRWGHCPPRAPIGRLDAVYGSLDHLLLLMGRLADFGAKDLLRKRRAQMEAEQRSTAQPTTSRPPRQGHPLAPVGQQPPPMYGMVPDPGPVRLPRGFDQAQHDRLSAMPAPSEGKSLEAATREAEAEWAAISHAFDVYAESLGPAYAPLSPEHMTPTATPFGPALYYRAYSIACTLILYYCGRIVCLRTQPSMPPAAMVAAGVAAPQTAQYANTIGRIFAGIQPIDRPASINPHHGAALMDGCMGLFHAGVQFRDPAQRGWTITRLHEVARLTGWQTSALIAAGCERSWMKAAEMGRGPPYTTMMDPTATDDRVAGRGRDPADLNYPPKDNNDRRFLTINAGTRVHWAIGVLGVEEDLKGMSLNA